MKNYFKIFVCSAMFSVLCIAFAIAGPVPDTGQTTSYTGTFGEDSDYNINPPSFTKLGLNGVELSDDATVEDGWIMTRDNVTGMIWEVKQNKDDTQDYNNPNDADNTYTWYDSNPETNGGYEGVPGDGTDTEDFINTLNSSNFGGFSDWRLPDPKELKSIVNSNVYNPSIDQMYFSKTVSSCYWSSTFYANSSINALYVSFDYGKVYYKTKSYSYYVRAVRGRQPDTFAYVDNGDGTVTDPNTGLMWQQANSGQMTWTAALSYCEGRSLAGYSDWRLPNDKELQSIVDYSKYSPSIDSVVFPGTMFSYYWSSTSSADNSDYAWILHFGTGRVDGNVYVSNRSCNYYVRAVRGGQSRSLGHLIILTPEQGDMWEPGTTQTIAWDTGEIAGNVQISLSRESGKDGTYETMVASTPNDGEFEWTVSGGESVNCVMKIEPLESGYEDKGTIQGFFSIKTPEPLNITTTTLPSGETTVEYSTRIRITGGIYPYTYDVVEGYGILPPGLTLNTENGTISGVPTTPGSFTFSIGVTDSRNAYAERQFSIEVTEKLEIVTEDTFSRGTNGTEYFGTIQASGGTLPHSFSRISGSLPTGLSLSSDGSISGTPSTTGTFNFTVRVSDASGRTADKAFHIEIVNSVVISTTKLDDGIVGEVYSQSLSSSGGYGSHVWAVYTGTLPSGLSFDNTTGAITGTPTEATYRTVVFVVSDEENRVAYKDLTFRVCDPLQILTSSVPDALVDAQYSEAIRLAGGIAPYSFSYVGQLPAGLNLNTNTGIISGTPTTAGFVNVTITVTDSTYPTNQSVTQNLGIRTTTFLTITTSAVLPNAKKDVSMNTVTLQAGGGPSPYTWAVIDGQMPSGITLNPNTGQLSGIPGERGDFEFTIQVTDTTANTSEKEFFLHVSDELAIETGSVPDGAKNYPYSFTFEADGGLLPYSWRITNGTLPAGLSLDGTTGTISGYPTTGQPYAFTIEVSDSDSPAQTAEKSFNMEILDQLYICAAYIPNGRINEAYSASIQAALGNPPYTWTLESGVLPAGLTMKSSSMDITIEGTPLETGSFTFTINVSDIGTPIASDSKEYVIEIYEDVVIETIELKNAVRGIGYTEDIIVASGKAPYTWQIVEGSLPDGLSLDTQSGHISGITTLVSGHSSTFKIRVTDSGNPSDFAEREYAINVIDPLEITTENIQDGIQNIYYEVPFEAEGGISPYTWSVSNGAIPTGMNLDTDTGVLSGTSYQCGMFNFTLKVEDASAVTNSITKSFQLKMVCIIGDANGDTELDIADAILAFKVALGITPETSVILNADINGDGKIGMEEVVYILREIAEQ